MAFLPKGFQEELLEKSARFWTGEDIRPKREVKKPGWQRDYVSGAEFDSSKMDMTVSGSRFSVRKDDGGRVFSSSPSKQDRNLKMAELKLKMDQASLELKEKEVELERLRLEAGKEDSDDEDDIIFSSYPSPDKFKWFQSETKKPPPVPPKPVKRGPSPIPRPVAPPPPPPPFFTAQQLQKPPPKPVQGIFSRFGFTTNPQTNPVAAFYDHGIKYDVGPHPKTPTPKKEPPVVPRWSAFEPPAKPKDPYEKREKELQLLREQIAQKRSDLANAMKAIKLPLKTLQNVQGPKTPVRTAQNVQTPKTPVKAAKNVQTAKIPVKTTKGAQSSRIPVRTAETEQKRKAGGRDPVEPTFDSEDEAEVSDSGDSDQEEEDEPHDDAAKKKRRHKKEKSGQDVDLAAALAASMKSMEIFLSRQGMSKDLPTFSGDPSEWPSFYAEYKETNREGRFTEAQKMSRLRKALKDSAKSSVKELLMLPNAADKIIEVLVRRFGRPELVIENLIEKTRRAAPVSEEKPETIIKFAEKVSNVSVCIEALECEQHLHNPILIKELVAKLPPRMKLQWGTEVKTSKLSPPKISDFACWISEIAECASYVTTTKTGKSEKESKFKRSNENVYATKEDSSGKKNSGCAYCSETRHAVNKCPKYGKLSMEDRWKWVLDGNRCFSCLKKNHRTRDCKTKKKCEHCSMNHHPSLHTEGRPPLRKSQTSEQSGSKEKSATPEPKEEKIHIVKSAPSKCQVLYKILPVKLFGPKGAVKTYAFMDDGSSVSLLDDSLATELGISGSPEALKMTWLSDKTHREDKSERISLKISGIWDTAKAYEMKDVRTVSNLTLPRQTVDVKKLAVQYPHLNGLLVESMEDVKPKILIGQKHWHLGINQQSIHANFDGPVASKTRLGWVIHGVVKQQTEDQEFSMAIQCVENDDEDLTRLVKQSFSTEAFGVKIPENLPKSKEVQRAEEILRTTTKRIGDRFETGLIWKSDEVHYPESYRMAYKRVISTEARLAKDFAMAEKYRQKIQHYLAMGYARKCSEEDLKITSGKVWYLPHFPVFNPNKPNKIRLVFDAAASSRGVSFNSELLAGPDLLVSLPETLLKFRQFKVAFSGDIKEMFHQIRIREEDVQAQRFLWRDNPKNPPEDYLMTAMIFGSASSPCSAQYVKNLNAEEFSDSFPAAARSIKELHYMDDWLQSVPTEAEAIKLIQEVIHVHKMGGFEICNFISSSKSILKTLPDDLVAMRTKNLCLESEMPSERVLGLWWDPNSDSFEFKLQFHKVQPDVLHGGRKPTKREILKIIMSVFDPLGLLSHFTIGGKILFKMVWLEKLDWDDPITDELEANWNTWMKNLDLVRQIKIPRCLSVKIPVADEIQLHIFCDASEDAFCSCAYLRVSFRDQVDVRLIMAKTRVSPVKPLSIPRLELQAAVMASRMKTTILEALEIKIKKTVLWTDSKSVVLWIRSDARKYKQFVAFRVGEILEASDVHEWRWISTKINPADDATRPFKNPIYQYESRWYLGPAFLQTREELWPCENPVSSAVSNEDLELKSQFTGVVNSAEEEEPQICCPDVERLEKWTKLVASTAYMLRFIQNKCNRKGKIEGPLTVPEVKKAEIILFRRCQMDSYPEEIRRLKAGLAVHKTSEIFQLTPRLDSDGILRVQGRLREAIDLSPAAKALIILQRNHSITRCLIRHYHQQVRHHGQETVVNLLRQRFWIPKIRVAVRHVWSSCNFCKIRRARPVPPEMGSLPLERVNKTSRPFVFVGIDYFGPIMVKIGRSLHKRWGVLFTCLVTRAVHIEIAHSLSTESCIMALQNFFRLRGRPKTIWSDNGTNLKGAEDELRGCLQRLNHDAVQEAMRLEEIEWKFIPPVSPHMGGSWERLVQSVKKVLYTVLKDEHPSDEVLRNFLMEAAYVVNCRPLTHVPLDHEDDEVLTPNHFLLGSASGDPPPDDFDDKDLHELRSKWRYAQRLADYFWSRWVQEYLPTLTKKTKWFQPVKPIRVGDVVIIIDPSLPRNRFPCGLVTEVFPGKDGRVRVAEVKTASGTYRRPAAKIAVLDIRDDGGPSPSGSGHEGENVAEGLKTSESKGQQDSCHSSSS